MLYLFPFVLLAHLKHLISKTLAFPNNWGSKALTPSQLVCLCHIADFFLHKQDVLSLDSFMKGSEQDVPYGEPSLREPLLVCLPYPWE